MSKRKSTKKSKVPSTPKKNKKTYIIPIISVLSLLIIATLIIFIKPSKGTYENLSWKYQFGTLTISGNGEMKDAHVEDHDILDGNGNFIAPPEFDKYPWAKFSDKAQKIVIKEGVTSVGKQAFSFFINVKKVTLPKSVTKISKGAFSDCASLTTVILQEGLKEIHDTAFDTCSELKEIAFPQTLLSIEKYAFRFCFSLESITIPHSTINIGDGAFSMCENLKKISIGKGLKTIGTNPFSGLSKDLNLTIDENNPNLILKDGVILSKDGKELICYPDFLTKESYSIPEGVETIKSYAFSSESLKEINTPESLKAIEESAFMLCLTLETINIEKNLQIISPSTFLNSYLKAINVSEQNPFFASVDGILLNKSKTELIKYPSSKYANVYEVSETVSEIGENAFYSSEPQGIILPSGIKKINQKAFCFSKIKSIAIPKTIEFLDSKAFEYASELNEINFEGTKKEWCELTGLKSEKDHTESYIIKCSDGTIEKSFK